MDVSAISLATIKEEAAEAARELVQEAVYSRPGNFFILGCSTSEVHGQTIGKASNKEIGRVIVEAILAVCEEHGLYLAVQGCEHINRALVVERAAAEAHHLLEVNVIPQFDAGGAASVAAFTIFDDPVCVEFIKGSLGLDIGDTEIGMHIRHVQRPVRTTRKFVGKARVTGLMYRPKLIGGERAKHF